MNIFLLILVILLSLITFTSLLLKWFGNKDVTYFIPFCIYLLLGYYLIIIIEIYIYQHLL